ncbi:MAG: ABC transporter ATP-binding protein, partial [Pseudomonadota bacterium]
MLRVDNVTKTFEDGFQALKGVSLNAGRGDFVTLLGPSGCGKTTLLKVIAGFLAPTTGSVAIGGVDVTGEPPEKRDTAMCFQSYALFPHMSVAQNIEFGPRQNKVAKEERLARLTALLQQVDLEPHQHKLPNALSGGQQQRVALARALAMRPGIVLFDEPLSNLDAKLRDQVRIEIRALQREHGFTAIYVTHDQAEALAMSDHVLVMRDGTVEQEGAPEEIYTAPRTSFVADFIGAANLLTGSVLSDDGTGRWQVQTEMGTVAVASTEPPAASSVHLSWRPEDAVLTNGADPGTDDENLITAPIIARVYQGAFTEYV